MDLVTYFRTVISPWVRARIDAKSEPVPPSWSTPSSSP